MRARVVQMNVQDHVDHKQILIHVLVAVQKVVVLRYVHLTALLTVITGAAHLCADLVLKDLVVLLVE